DGERREDLAAEELLELGRRLDPGRDPERAADLAAPAPSPARPLRSPAIRPFGLRQDGGSGAQGQRQSRETRSCRSAHAPGAYRTGSQVRSPAAFFPDVSWVQAPGRCRRRDRLPAPRGCRCWCSRWGLVLQMYGQHVPQPLWHASVGRYGSPPDTQTRQRLRQWEVTRTPTPQIVWPAGRGSTLRSPFLSEGSGRIATPPMSAAGCRPRTEPHGPDAVHGASAAPRNALIIPERPMRMYAFSLPPARRFALVLCAFVSAHAAGQSSDPANLIPPDAPVRLPWSEVLKLLERSGHRDESPPRRAVVGSATAEGEARAHGLTVRVVLPLLLLDDDWTAVPIWGSEVTIRRATLDGQPASFAVENGAHVLLARGKGAHTLFAELVLAAGGSGAQATVPFATPTPVS